eukprot:1575397-Prymnesium_polylepis.1
MVRHKAVFVRYTVLRCPSGTRYVTMSGLTGSRRVPALVRQYEAWRGFALTALRVLSSSAHS